MADGMYYYEISVLRKSDQGRREKCDCVPNVLPVTVYNTEAFGMSTEKWDSMAWGHMMLQPAQIIGKQ